LFRAVDGTSKLSGGRAAEKKNLGPGREGQVHGREVRTGSPKGRTSLGDGQRDPNTILDFGLLAGREGPEGSFLPLGPPRYLSPGSGRRSRKFKTQGQNVVEPQGSSTALKADSWPGVGPHGRPPAKGWVAHVLLGGLDHTAIDCRGKLSRGPNEQAPDQNPSSPLRGRARLAGEEGLNLKTCKPGNLYGALQCSQSPHRRPANKMCTARRQGDPHRGGGPARGSAIFSPCDGCPEQKADQDLRATPPDTRGLRLGGGGGTRVDFLRPGGGGSGKTDRGSGDRPKRFNIGPPAPRRPERRQTGIRCGMKRGKAGLGGRRTKQESGPATASGRNLVRRVVYWTQRLGSRICLLGWGGRAEVGQFTGIGTAGNPVRTGRFGLLRIHKK